jgi:Cu2+-exporting ATPase/Cu+-exporting ATPase
VEDLSGIKEKVRVIGVDCPTCVLAIQKSLVKVGASIDVDVATGEAVVVYDPNKTSLADINTAIREAGYDLEKAPLTVNVELEPEEVLNFERKVSRFRGVFSCHYSPATDLVKITYNPLTTSPREVIEAIRNLGYEVREVQEAYRWDKHEKPQWIPIASFIIGLAVVMWHFLEAFHMAPPPPSIVFFAAATIVMLLNFDLVRRGLASLSRLSPTMESLIALSSLVAYITGIAQFLANHESIGMFEVPAGVLGFVSAGTYLEGRMRKRAFNYLYVLASTQAGKVRVIRDGNLVEVDAGEVKPGELVEVRAGERILVDGVVVEGWGYVDESTFTGEPTPVLKSAEKRDVVLSGTTLISGFLGVRATRVGRETNLAYVVEAVREAQFHKPQFQRVADRIVGYLTWVIIAVSTTTFLFWVMLGGASLSEAALFAASVLAVACPCPLGIAVPLVVAAAIINATRMGVLARSGDVFERILKIDTVVFDKTGTLTVGKPKVHEVIFLEDAGEEVLRYLCSAERRSEHPLASAVLEYCSEKRVDPLEPEHYEHFPGLGLVAKVNGAEVIAGSRRLLEMFNISIPGGVDERAEREAQQGSTVIFVALNRNASALVLVKDRIREDASKVVSFFKEKGVTTMLATGDSKIAAENLSKELSLDDAYAELRPEDKADLVEKLQQNGRRVLFVGDGINDAVALSKAFVGVAMGGGADISKEAGDIVLTRGDLESLMDLYKLSSLVRRKALQNLTWAFAYNLTLVPVAAGALWKSFGILLRPELAAAIMMASDIAVVVNAVSMLRA